MKRMFEFTDDGNTCVIHTPETPRHWYNYLWNENGYCAQISQMGHGRSYYLNGKAQMCQINKNSDRYVYLRDDETKEYWNIGFGPVNEPLEEYCCLHGITDTVIRSKNKNMEAEWHLHVPTEDYCEVWRIRLCNTGTKTRQISLFPAVSFSLEGFSYPRYYEMYRCMETTFDREMNGIYCDSAHPFAPHGRYHAFLASSEKVFAYDGDLAAFCGSASAQTMPDASQEALFQRPRVVAEGLDCTNSEAALFILGGVLQHKITLKPGAFKEIRIIFGISLSREDAGRTAEKYKKAEAAEASFLESRNHYYQKYADLSVSCPDDRINAMMNFWIKKQVDFCIVGKKGVRDNLQIAVGLLNYRQKKAEEEILECLRHQFRDGHAVLTWYPYDDTRYSDQPFWIIWAVCELIKETGDYSILDREIEWQDGGSASVRDHLKAAVERLIGDKGPNGLVRIFFADWNDALNITTDPEAESVMLSHQFCLALKELSRLAQKTGDWAYADYLKKEYQVLKRQINEKAWDGKWYVRALHKDGKIGSSDCEGSRIYLNAQTWAVLSGVVPEERLPLLVKAVDDMEHDFGFPLNQPPYPSYSPLVGRMSGMLPGLFENGGVYCHATGFKILMDCRLGQADKALRTLKKIMPDSPWNPSENSGAEPYVFTNCYSTHPRYYGQSYQSWTTGTSAWCLMGLYEGILGVKRDYEGLRVTPCFPSSWDKAEMTRTFRGAKYHFRFENPEHLENGSPGICVDGRMLEDAVLPDFRDGKWHEVKVVFNSIHMDGRNHQ